VDLFENPFYILRATPRDNRQRIVELAEERSLVLDPDVCNKARADLLHPIKRIAAEVGWFPGTSPERLNNHLQLVESSNAYGIDELNVSDLVKANLIAAGFTRISQLASEDVIEWSIKLAKVNEDVIAQEIIEDLNNDRIASGFPEVTDAAVVEQELVRRKEHFRHILTESLNSLESQELVRVVTSIVEKMTDGGSKRAPALIDDLVEYYEVLAQEFLESEKSNIEAIITNITHVLNNKVSDTTLDNLISKLIDTAKNWDMVAQPIQVSTLSRGLDHNESHSVAGMIRNLTVLMYNDYGKLDQTQRLTGMLIEVFAEVDPLAELLTKDKEILEEIADKKKGDKVYQDIYTLCDTAIKAAEINPNNANTEAKRIIAKAAEYIDKMKRLGATDDDISFARDMVAQAIVSCTVEYCNKTKSWNEGLRYFNDARKYASDKQIIDKIEDNINTLEGNIENAKSNRHYEAKSPGIDWSSGCFGQIIGYVAFFGIMMMIFAIADCAGCS